jgi:hypothetical protein
LERYECRILADVWVKGIGAEFKARETYTQSVQHACRSFQAFLESRNSSGFMVADFRTTQLNDQVAHSIFTQKYRAKGDPFARIYELPTFGISNNHVGLQITDVLCTALLFPMASSVYCFGHVTGVHVNARDLSCGVGTRSGLKIFNSKRALTGAFGSRINTRGAAPQNCLRSHLLLQGRQQV